MPNQTVTIAQALASNGTSLQVLDTAANIAGALPNATLVARCASFTLSAAATLATAAADKLATLGSKFHLGGEALTVQDTVANMTASANAAGLALATTRQIADAAYNLLNAPSSAFTNIANVILTGAPVLSMAQLTKLESLPGFTVGSGAHFVTQDALSAYIPVLSAHLGYFAAATAVQVKLDGTQIGAAGVTSLATLANEGKTVSFYSSATDNVLNVTASAQDLANAAAAMNQIGALIGMHFTVSNDGTAVTAAVAAGLASITQFTPASHTLTVSDTGAALTALAGSVFGHGFPQITVTSGNLTGTAAQLLDPALHLNSGVTVTMLGAGTVTVAQAATLEALPGFALAQGASLTVADTITNLLHNSSVLGIATAITATDSETVSAANATLLSIVAAAHPGQFSLGGHSLTVSDTAANLAGLSAPAIGLATFFLLSASGTVTAAQFTTLRDTLHVALGGNTLTIEDTAAHLLALTGSLSLATSCVLTGANPATAAQAVALAALPGFALASGASLNVSDTVSDILHDASSLGFATTITATDSETVSAANAALLETVAAAHPGHFSLGGHSLTVSDTAANLIGLTAPTIALATGFALSASATVTAAQFTTLRDTLHVALAGHTLTIADTAANLLALTGSLSLATSCVMSGTPTVTAAQAAALAALPGFTLASGATLTVSDTIANILHYASSLGAVTAITATDSESVSAANANLLASIAAAHPGHFSLGGHSLTVSDTGSNLATLTAPAIALASGFTLSASGAVTAAQFTTLRDTLHVALGGNTLTIDDTATNLLGLTGSLSLATACVLTGTNAVTATQAVALAALPGFALASGASLNVSDTIANILHDASSLALATTITATDSESVSAANATLLASVAAAHPGHFSLGGHNLTVSDTAANLVNLTAPAIALATGFTLSASGTVTVAQYTTLANTLHVASGGYTLTIDDTATNLLTLSNLPSLVSATVLSGPATVTAVQVMQLSQLPSFSTGGFALTASDTAANIALHEYAILHYATVGVVTDSGPVNTAQADALALLSNAGKLAFQVLDTLVVSDSFAALTAAANAGGVALAYSLVVTDTATNLAAAAMHNWGSRTVSYVLSASGVITGAQATTLAALGPAFSANGFALSVADNAANVLAASAALTSLNISATVNDSAATLGSNSAALLALGSHLAAVHATDLTPVSAAVAAGLAPLVAKLSGTIAVQDNAANIDSALASLTTLGTHAVITATDSAANIGAHATDLATLGTALTVSLTDTVPVLAAAAAALDPVAARLASGTSLAVTDTAANIAADASALGMLGTALGTITLLGGNTVTAAQAAALLPLQSHLGSGVELAVTGNAASIVANQSALASLHSDGRLASVTDAGDTAAAVAAAVTALNALNASVTISDTESNVLTAIATLAQVTGLTAVTITDAPNPIFTLSIAAYAADRSVLNLVTNNHTIAISDTASAIETDLASTNSVLTAITTPLTITPQGGAALVLPQAVALKPSVVTILPDLIGPLQVTGVDVAHLGAVMALSPQSVTVTDTAANIQADLLSGNSQLLADLSHISSITVTGGGTIAITAAVALTAHVDDGANSVVGLLSGTTLSVVQATVAQIPSLLALHIPPATISISDTAANITAALTNANSPILTSAATIVALHVTDGNPVVLTEAQDMAAGVNDGPHAALTKLTGAALDVTGVSVSQLPAVEGTASVPTSISITDTGSDISGGVTTLVGDLSNLGPITISSGTVILSPTQAMMTNVASGPGCLVSLLPGHAYSVSGAAVSEIGLLLSLQYPPGSIAVTDSSTNLVTDLLSGHSQWAAFASTVTVTGGTLTLTDSQADAVAAGGLNVHFAALVHGTLVDITGVPVSDLVTLAGFHTNLSANGNALHLELADTALNLANDLASGNPAETQEAAYINSTTLTGAGGTLTTAQLASVAGISGLITNGVTVPVQGGAAAIANLSTGERALAGSVTVNDTDANVGDQLGLLQSVYNGALTITLTNANPSIAVTAAEYSAVEATIAAITNLGCVTVTGNASQVAGIESQLVVDPHVAAIQITDSPVNVATYLPQIEALGSLAYVTLSGPNPNPITAAVGTALVAANLPHITYGNVVVVDTASQIAAMAEASSAAQAFLVLHDAHLTGGSPANVTLVDAYALLGLGNSLNVEGETLNIWDTASHLTQPGAAAMLTSLANSGLISNIYLLAPGNSVTLTAPTAAALLAIPNLKTYNPNQSGNAIYVADTAQHLDSNYTALFNDLPSLSGITITSSATITGQTLTDLQSLGATADLGVTLAVSDTATNILTAASAILPTVQASSYALDASASVTSSQALALAALSNFSPGAYTLTVALNANTAITVTQANQLGALGSSLVVTGAEYTVTGSAAGLAALTPAGAAIAHVTLHDTLADILALSPTSILLSGAVSVITDSTGLTATQASAFISLMNSAGVSSANVSFNGSTEAVTDSIAALRTLTSSTLWTSNPGLAAHFALVAQDTVANLTSTANAAFLHTLSGETLSASATVNATTAESLATLPHFSVGTGNTLTVSDNATNLLAPANAAGVAIGTTVTLNGAATVTAAGAETLLQMSNFHLTQPLTIMDTATNLLDGTLSGLIAGNAQVTVSLSGPQTVDAQTATALVALQGFADTTDMHIVDGSSYLLQSSAYAAELMAASVSLAGNETVSAATVLRLAETPHFTYSGGTLSLANNDFANAQTLQAIADMGTNFSENGHSLTLTQNNLSLAPTELAAIIADGGVVANGYVISAMPVNATYTDIHNVLTVNASGVAGATINVYGASGAAVPADVSDTNGNVVVATPDSAPGNNFSITETVNGVESAPVVVLDQTALENLVSLAPSSFASIGQIQIDTGKYINLYTAGATLPNGPALVYDPVAHTISLDMPNAAPVTLITLGASTAPASLQSTEILIKHHS